MLVPRPASRRLPAFVALTPLLVSGAALAQNPGTQKPQDPQPDRRGQAAQHTELLVRIDDEERPRALGLFRQPALFDWPSVVAAITRALAAEPT